MDIQATPDVRGYICHNRRWRGAIHNPITGVEEVVEAFPWITIIWRGVPMEGLWRVGARLFDERMTELIALESQAAAREHNLAWTMALDDPVPDACLALVTARHGPHRWERAIALRTHKLYGTVTDFDGRPRAAIVCVNGFDGIATQAGEDGAYVLSLPDCCIPSLLVADADFGSRTLECWVYDYHPQGDLSLDLHIGEMELYELHVWRGYAGIKVDFTPMSVGLVRQLMAGDRRAGLTFVPKLSKSDVTVELDGAVVDILHMSRRREALAPGEGWSFGVGSRWEYSLQLADPPAHPGRSQVLRVTVRHRLATTKGYRVEQGEGLSLGLTSGVSVNNQSVVLSHRHG